MLFIHPSIFYTYWSLEPVPASLGHKAGYDDQQRVDLLINSEQRNILLPHHVVLYIINKFPPCWSFSYMTQSVVFLTHSQNV